MQYQGQCKPKCLKPCPRILRPICATDKNGNTKTFNTQCELDNNNCEYPDDRKFKENKILMNENELILHISFHIVVYIKAADGECPRKYTTVKKWICALPNGCDGKPFTMTVNVYYTTVAIRKTVSLTIASRLRSFYLI